nr:glycosyltransferase family 2 protein [uncultured Desulfuromonas sp.]
MDLPLTSIVVPVYKSQNTLQELFERIDLTFRDLERPYELILVEDCGGDNSWDVMQGLSREHTQVRIAQLTRNFGQHNALICGFSMARGEFVVTMDDDLQHPPEEIPRLIATIEETGVDAVHGVPRERKHALYKNVGSYVYRFLLGNTYKGLERVPFSSFRIIRKNIVDEICRCRTPNPAIGLLLLSITRRMVSIDVDHHARKNGQSTYTLGKLVRLFFNGVIYNTDLPLKAVFVMGIVCLMLSALLGCYYLGLYLLGYVAVSGWTTLVLLVLFFSGIGMFSLGIVGEYLTRILQEVNRVPQYIVRHKED